MLDYSSNRQRTAEIRVELSRYQTGSRDELGGEHLVVLFHSYKVQYLYLKDVAMKISRKREKGKKGKRSLEAVNSPESD